MKTSELKQLIREEINNILKEENPAEKEKVQGSANFAKIAGELGVEAPILKTAVDNIKKGDDPLSLGVNYKNALVLLVANLIKTNKDNLVQAFANELKKLEVE